ncbi:MAG: glycosyltransferase [Pseudomonadota bacterium]
MAPLEASAADPRLIDKLGADRALRDRVLPWRSEGAVTVLAAVDPVWAEAQRERYEKVFGPVSIATADRTAFEKSLLELRRGALAKRAEHRTPASVSCRTFKGFRLLGGGSLALIVFAAALVFAPVAVFLALTFWAGFWLLASTLLRVAAAHSSVAPPRTMPALADEDLPIISILIPLFREKNIVERLIRRLSTIDYPVDRLDLCLVVEKQDTITQETLKGIEFPPSMRTIIVPPGNLQTKPRALNFAIDFTDGEIIGIYDAEDAPATDQLRRVAAQFAVADRRVACLQGRLDFYNSDRNWLARCFTIDYATWFHAILPGLDRLRLPLPLGGTTLFFRRDAIEALGGWDAHNVTEDADLGIRLTRRGWRTEIINTVTDEEANCRAWPWVKQRSRWIKGYALTWLVHMRAPRTLLADLGLWRFLGFQIIFLGALTQYALAPLLWSFWIAALGLAHPVTSAMAPLWAFGLVILFVAAELANATISVIACRRAGHWRKVPWVPFMLLYYPLGAIAAWKAFWEILRKPFFWDKTEHGFESN